MPGTQHVLQWSIARRPAPYVRPAACGSTFNQMHLLGKESYDEQAL